MNLVDFASDAAFTVAEDLRILAWNAAAREMLGYSAPEVVGRSCYEVLQADLPGGEPLCTPACQGSLCFDRCQPFAVEACLACHRDGRSVRLGLSTVVVPSKPSPARDRATTAIIFLHVAQAPSSAESLPQPLRVYTFGRFGLVLDGGHVSVDRWQRKQALTLLKFLVMHRGTAVHRDRLIECLWPGVDDSKGRERAEKRARRDGASRVAPEHVRPFLDREAAPAPRWSAAGLARLDRVPDLVRGSVRQRVVAHASDAGAAEITPEIVEAAMAESRETMQRAMAAGGHKLGRDESE